MPDALMLKTEQLMVLQKQLDCDVREPYVYVRMLYLGVRKPHVDDQWRWFDVRKPTCLCTTALLHIR